MSNFDYLDLNDEEIDELLGPCKCGSRLEFVRSSCTDPDCCGIPNRISCDSCYFEQEGFYEDIIDNNLKQKYREILEGKRTSEVAILQTDPNKKMREFARYLLNNGE